MASEPSSRVTLAVHRGAQLISVSEVATEALATELAASLARGGRWCVVRNGHGLLVYAHSSAGEIITADRGSPSDLWRWMRPNEEAGSKQ